MNKPTFSMVEKRMILKQRLDSLLLLGFVCRFFFVLDEFCNYLTGSTCTSSATKGGDSVSSKG